MVHRFADMVFKPDCSEKSLEVARGIWKNSSPSNYISFACGSGDPHPEGGESFNKYARAACHGHVAGWGSAHRKRYDWVTSRLSVYTDADRKHLNKIWEFVGSKDCSLSRFILNADTMVTDRALVASTDAPRHILHLLNLISRRGSEHSYGQHHYAEIEPFLDNKMVALWFALHLGSNFSDKQVVVFSGAVHGGVFYNVGVDSLKTFAVDHGVVTYDTATFRENRNYTGTSSMMGQNRGQASAYNVIADLLKEPDIAAQLAEYRSKRDGKVEVAVPNPFKPQPATSGKPLAGQLTGEEFKNFLCPILNERFPTP